MENNTVVANNVTSTGNASVSNLLIENGGTPQVNLLVKNNYYDIGANIAGKYGANFCIKQSIDITNLTNIGNISLQSGNDNSSQLFYTVGAGPTHCN